MNERKPDKTFIGPEKSRPQVKYLVARQKVNYNIRHSHNLARNLPRNVSFASPDIGYDFHMSTVKRSNDKIASRNQCRESLGQLGWYMFMEFSSIAQPRQSLKAPTGLPIPQPKALLFKWTRALIVAAGIPYNLETGKNESALKALVLEWHKNNRGYPIHRIATPGLEFVVSSVKLGNAENHKKWQGRLILIYERKTQSLFHYIVDVRSATKTPQVLIWFAISQAMAVLDKSDEKFRLKKKTVFFPSGLSGKPINNSFQQAEESFQKAKLTPWPLTLVWHSKKTIPIDTKFTNLQRYIGRTHSPIKLEMDNINEFRRQMQSLATAVTKQLRNATLQTGATTPSWKALNDVRVRER